MTLEDTIQAAIKAHEIPGAVLVASNSKGDFYYENAFGLRSLKDDCEDPVTVNDVFWMASCTKLMTAIAVFQCVERGQFTLDEDVTQILPELSGIEILKGFEGGTEKSILVKPSNKITLRLLLSHSSGLAYDIFNPLLQRWRRSRGEDAQLTSGSLIHRITAPLVFEPGKEWAYGTGYEWAGIMIERASGMGLEEYMRKNIWDPLNIKGISFHPESNGLLESLVDMSVRLGGANQYGTPAKPEEKVVWSEDIVWKSMEEESGGAGTYGRANDYVKILQSITVGDGKLLKQESLDQMFKPQLSKSSQAYLMRLCKSPELSDGMAPSMPMGTKVDYGLGGMLCLEDIEGRRRSGTMFWSGLPNMYWFSDRKSGMCGMYASQLVPTGDPKSIELFAQFEATMYERAQALERSKKERL